MVINWFNFSRRTKRLYSFKTWLLNNWINHKPRAKKSPKILIKNFMLNCHKYRYLGMNFLLSRNIGLDMQSSYLTIFHNNVKNSIAPLDLQHSLRMKATFFNKWLAVSSLRRIWMKPSKRIDLKRKALVSQIRAFVKKRFITKRFFTNAFWRIFNNPWFIKRPRTWMERSQLRRFLKARRRKAIDKTLKFSLFSSRFIKYLFYYRYFQFTKLNISSIFPFSLDIFSHYYIKVIGSQFAPTTKLNSILSKPLPEFSLTKNNTWLNVWFKRFRRSSFSWHIPVFCKSKHSFSLKTYFNKMENLQVVQLFLLIYLKQFKGSFRIDKNELLNRLLSQNTISTFKWKRWFKLLSSKKLLLMFVKRKFSFCSQKLIKILQTLLGQHLPANLRKTLITLILNWRKDITAKKKFDIYCLNKINYYKICMKRILNIINFLKRHLKQKHKFFHKMPFNLMTYKFLTSKYPFKTIYFTNKIKRRILKRILGLTKIERELYFKKYSYNPRAPIKFNRFPHISARFLKRRSHPLTASINPYNPQSKFHLRFINDSFINSNKRYNNFFAPTKSPVVKQLKKKQQAPLIAFQHLYNVQNKSGFSAFRNWWNLFKQAKYKYFLRISQNLVYPTLKNLYYYKSKNKVPLKNIQRDHFRRFKLLQNLNKFLQSYKFQKQPLFFINKAFKSNKYRLTRKRFKLLESYNNLLYFFNIKFKKRLKNSYILNKQKLFDYKAIKENKPISSDYNIFWFLKFFFPAKKYSRNYHKFDNKNYKNDNRFKKYYNKKAINKYQRWKEQDASRISFFKFKKSQFSQYDRYFFMHKRIEIRTLLTHHVNIYKNYNKKLQRWLKIYEKSKKQKQRLMKKFLFNLKSYVCRGSYRNLVKRQIKSKFISRNISLKLNKTIHSNNSNSYNTRSFFISSVPIVWWYNWHKLQLFSQSYFCTANSIIKTETYFSNLGQKRNFFFGLWSL